jgi:hypothetical protein
MQIIQCTGKLQKEMGLKPSDLSCKDPDPVILGRWHANLIYINRRKCILFANDKTLFNFIASDVSRPQIKKLSELFLSYLSCVLSDEGIDDIIKNKILSEYEAVEYAKTKSKSVLGSLNDLAYHYTYHIQEAGGVHSAMVPEIIRKLNRMPMGALEYKYSIEVLNECIANQT